MACLTGRTFRKAAFAAAALILSVSAAFSAESLPAQTVSIPVQGNVSLSAVYAPPAPGRGVIVMLHGLDSNKGEWNTFADAARAAGWGTLAYDARGHGDSAKSRASQFRAFGPGGPGTPWDLMPPDLEAVIKFVEGKNVPLSSIAVVGASLGANVAARYASRGAPLKGLVLLSPGLNYVEFRPDRDVTTLGCRALMVVSAGDRYAHLSAQKLRALVPAIDLWTDVPPGHGVQMFDAALMNRILVWLEGR